MRSILPIQADSHPYADLGILSCEGTLGFSGDPFLIQRLGAIGVQPDIVQAREWLNKN